MNVFYTGYIGLKYDDIENLQNGISNTAVYIFKILDQTKV